MQPVIGDSRGADGAHGAPLRARFGGALAQLAQRALPGEVLFGWLRAERSDFVRFNRGRVRQAGTVERATLEIRIVRGARQARHTLTLSGDGGEDQARVAAALATLRDALGRARPDPWLWFDDRPARSEHHAPATQASADEIVGVVGDAAGGADLVGILAAGPMACGMCSSLGHDHWHETSTWSFDYSVHAGGDKAVKDCVSGTDWDAAALRDAVSRSARSAALLMRPARRIDPGRHRCLLSPRAVADLVEMLGWGGFSARALAAGDSPLERLHRGESVFDARVSIDENLRSSGVPAFQPDGSQRPGVLPLVREGRSAGMLVSSRTARERSIEGNGAQESESPEALVMAPGDLAESDALARLGTGIAIANLWYLAFSDRHRCRVTGMTRFATMWVEDGEPVAPIEVMRFDDSLYRVFGESLEALTARAVRMPDTDSYDGRRFGVTTAPGALLGELAFTL